MNPICIHLFSITTLFLPINVATVKCHILSRGRFYNNRISLIFVSEAFISSNP